MFTILLLTCGSADADAIASLALAKAARQRIVAVKPAPVVPKSVVVPTAGPHWTHPGTIYSHLISEHGFSPAQLAGLTAEQMLTLHDQAHNAKKAADIPVYQQACPNGQCPAQPQSRRGIFGFR